MQHYIDLITTWMNANPALAALIWPIASMLFTAILHKAETSNVPVIGKIVSIVKAIGVDGPKVAGAIASVFKQKPPAPVLQAASDAVVDKVTEPNRAPPNETKVEDVLPPRSITDEVK